MRRNTNGNGHTGGVGLLHRLSAPFRRSELSWRLLRGGTSDDGKPWALLSCWASRNAVLRRLDEVLGLGWSSTFTTSDGVVTCTISIVEPETNRVTIRSDCSGIEGRGTDAGKAAASYALRRAAAAFGIGRSLWDSDDLFGEATFDRRPRGRDWVRCKIDDRFAWARPTEACWASLPAPPGYDAGFVEDGEPKLDAVTELRQLLKHSVGCETEQDADAVVALVGRSAGYEGLRNAKASEEDARAVLGLLKNSRRRFKGWGRILAAARAAAETEFAGFPR